MKKQIGLVVSLILWSLMGWAQDRDIPARLPRDTSRVINTATAPAVPNEKPLPRIGDQNITPFWNWMQFQRGMETGGLMGQPRIEFPDFGELSRKQTEAPLSNMNLVVLPSLQSVRDASAAQKPAENFSLEKEYTVFEARKGFQLPVKNDPELLKLLSNPAM